MSEKHTPLTHTPNTQVPGPSAAGRQVARRSGMIRVVADLAIYLLVAAIWLSLPIGKGSVAGHIKVPASPQPRSETRHLSFELKRFCPTLTITTQADPYSATVQMTLLDSSGKRLASWPLGKGRHTSTFSVGKGFPAGRYTLHFAEIDTLGAYSATVCGRESLPAAGRLWLLFAVMALISGPMYAFGRLSARRRPAGPSSSPTRAGPQASRKVFLGACLAMVALPLGALVHEGGHAIAQAVFGGWDPSRSNLLGLWGPPHSTGLAHHLSAWQISIIAIAGPALPTLVACLSFALWVSAPGRRTRSRLPVLDLFWSGLTGVLLFGQLGMLAPVAGLVTDTDYSGFVNAFGSWKPAADGLLIAAALVNAVLIWGIGKHLLARRRQTAPAASRAYEASAR